MSKSRLARLSIQAPEVAELQEKLRAAQERIEAAKAALGEHPDTDIDLAERISQIRDEGRAHFHTVSRLQERIAQLTAENEWMLHNAGLFNEWAREWQPAIHGPLIPWLRIRLSAARKEPT